MVALKPLVSEFALIGRLNDLLVDSKGRVRSLYLSTSEAEYAIAVQKKQPELSKYLQPGCKLKVIGMRKNKLHQSEVEYLAYGIELLEQTNELNLDSKVKSDRQKLATVLVCQGKSCCQRGARTIYSQLQQKLLRADLTDKVTIKTTGCLKQCKQAPNIIMPDKKRHSCVRPEQIAAIVKKTWQ